MPHNATYALYLIHSHPVFGLHFQKRCIAMHCLFFLGRPQSIPWKITCGFSPGFWTTRCDLRGKTREDPGRFGNQGQPGQDVPRRGALPKDEPKQQSCIEEKSGRRFQMPFSKNQGTNFEGRVLSSLSPGLSPGLSPCLPACSRLSQVSILKYI